MSNVFHMHTHHRSSLFHFRTHHACPARPVPARITIHAKTAAAIPAVNFPIISGTNICILTPAV